MSELVRPDDFFEPTPPPRIMGSEMEYIVDPRITAHRKSLLRPHVSTSLNPLDGFLINGARVYEDLGNLEYCTPESLGPLEVTLQDHAGAMVVGDMVELYNYSESAHVPCALRRSGSWLQKDNSHGLQFDSNGYHENLLSPVWDSIDTTSEEAEETIALLQLHIVTRNVWYGAGLAHVDGRYTAGQKVCDTSKHEDLVGVKYDSEDWMRVEVRNCDPHILPYATFLGFATSSLVLRLYEHRLINTENVESFSMGDTNREEAMMQLVATDSRETGEIRIKLLDKSSPTMLEVQYRLAQLAVALSRQIQLPKDEERAAHEWLWLVESIRVQGMTAPKLFGKVEHETKRRLMKRHAGDSEIDRRMRVALDIAFSMYGSQLSTETLARVRDPLTQLVQHNAANRRYIAPRDTRAHARKTVIEDGGFATDWGGVITKSGKAYRLDNPYVSEFDDNACLIDPLSVQY